MSRTLLLLVVATLLAQPCLAAVTFDWAYVGNAGNAGNVQSQGTFGAVPYNFAIGKTEVTNAQYTAFLNAVDPTGADALALYNTSMADNYGGILRQYGNPDGARYVAKAGREQNPVTYVSFLDAMRFTNWLHNGQGLFGSLAGDTETGAYTIGNGANEVRSANAKYWIPSEDEWYKAAYHDASAETAGVYFNYATGSDIEPVSDHPGDNPAAVNYLNDDAIANSFNDGYAVSGSTIRPVSTNPFTDVGAYTAATSSYGTSDQNGNVEEWNEAALFSLFRGMRGGSWASNLSYLPSEIRSFDNPLTEFSILGFRVATVPEPAALALATILFSALGFVTRRA